MISIGIFELTTILALPIIVSLGMSYHLLKKRNSKLKDKIEDLQKEYYQLVYKYEEIQDKIEVNTNFNQSLKEAEITTNLQKPRLQAQTTKEKLNNSNDKYQYIRSLSGSGMAAEEIGNVLAISSHEAQQLMNLAKLANAN